MIQSQPYTIPRFVLSRIAGLYYLRTFWFILAGPFLFGLALLFFGPNQIARVFGLLLVIWPTSIFARAFLLVKKTSKAWAKPTIMTVADDAFLFESLSEEGGGKYRLKFDVVRKVIPLMGYQLLQTRRYGYVAVPVSALPAGTFLGDYLKKQS